MIGIAGFAQVEPLPGIRSHWGAVLGKVEPAPEDRKWFGDVRKARVIGESLREGYRRIELEIPIETDFYQKHVLLLPAGQGDGPFPAVIAWSSTSPDYAEPEKWWGAWLARRGYVVLTSWSFIRHYRNGSDFRTGAPDLLRARFGLWLPLARMAYDARRQHAYLASRRDVDARRVGFIGFSLGAKAAVYVAAFAPEIAATVAVDPGLPLRHKTNWFDPWYLDGDRSRRMLDGHDHDELLMLAAPRAVMIIGGNAALHSDDARTAPLVERAREVYRRLGVPDKLEFVLTGDGHSANGPSIDPAWQRFFERHLQGR